MSEKYLKSSFIKIALFFLMAFFSLTLTTYAVSNTAATTEELKTNLTSVFKERQTSYSVAYTGNNLTLKTDIALIIGSIYDSDDYIRYTAKGYSYSYSSNGVTTNITFNFNYWNTLAQDAFVDTRVSEVLSQIITTGMSDFQKQKAIHDWIVTNVAYDTTLVQHSDYAGLVSPFKTVCQGYALLSYKMLNAAGIQTKIIEGTASGVAHAWNLVYLDSAWYHFDATWDDPVPDVAGRVVYNYYNLTDTQIKTNHTWTKSYPAATTNFADTITSKITSDPTNATVYNEISTALGLNYLSAENTVNDATELNAKIQDAIKNHLVQIKVRYMKGSTLTTDLSTAIKGISNITSYSYSKTDYVRSSLTGDILLTLSFTYYDPISVTAVSVSNNNLSLAAGLSSTLTATVSPSNASNKTILWTSSNTAVATVVGGVVKAVGGGTATITAKTADGGFTATCTITVTQGVSSVTFTPTTAYVKLGGTDVTLTPSVLPTGATDKSLKWTSSNPSIATVDSTGKVHAVAYGTAIISAISVQDPTKIGKCTVTVPVPVTGVTVNSTSNYVKMGTPLTLTTAFAPTNATIKTVTWSSSNEAIAKISATGVVTPVAIGSVTITAKTTDGSFTSTKTLNVVYGVTSVTLDKTIATLKVGGTDLTLVPTINPTNATVKTLIWKSSNPNVATVDSNGTVHAVAAGTVVISATSEQDPTKIAKCTITVTN
ncbi:Ig-like domain-containing protein [Clostridium cellulovorans]|uniref:Ig domain protein group 2 domain protein n=1 Tax=Clostridium cellulovorans (strain ATCC 35296 / DSM 3052 / OCM 3 / 743B) TaxID=573061 RepID=D9SUR1_CLOC7|nr:Ig-like domain-containing protein [Clostridium cellulovorans]ADL50966.1 Ig domain protein group 2 domain protein [Clostridium cellulovorans 743B]